MAAAAAARRLAPLAILLIVAGALVVGRGDARPSDRDDQVFLQAAYLLDTTDVSVIEAVTRAAENQFGWTGDIAQRLREEGDIQTYALLNLWQHAPDLEAKPSPTGRTLYVESPLLSRLSQVGFLASVFLLYWALLPLGRGVALAAALLLALGHPYRHGPALFDPWVMPVAVAAIGCWLRDRHLGAAGLAVAVVLVKPNYVFLLPAFLLASLVRPSDGDRPGRVGWSAASVHAGAMAFVAVVYVALGREGVIHLEGYADGVTSGYDPRLLAYSLVETVSFFYRAGTLQFRSGWPWFPWTVVNLYALCLLAVAPRTLRRLRRTATLLGTLVVLPMVANFAVLGDITAYENGGHFRWINVSIIGMAIALPLAFREGARVLASVVPLLADARWRPRLPLPAPAMAFVPSTALAYAPAPPARVRGPLPPTIVEWATTPPPAPAVDHPVSELDRKAAPEPQPQPPAVPAARHSLSARRRWLVALAALALLRSALLGFLTPPYQASDEPWHLDYARVVADGGLPVLGRTLIDPAIIDHDYRVSRERDLTVYGIDRPAYSREAFQPPLGYVIPALGYKLLADPGPGLTWFRAVNAVLGALLALLAFSSARRAFPNRPYAGPTAGLAAVCLPSVAIVASTANNDALGVAMATAAVSLGAVIARRGGRSAAFLSLGALVGLAGMAKASGLLLLVPAAVACAIAPVPAGRRRLDLTWMRGLLVAGAAAIVSLPWALHNFAAYGDPLGTGAFDRFPVLPGNSIGGAGLLFGAEPDAQGAQSFWPALGRSAVGLMRWSDLGLPGWAYLLAGTVALGGAVVVWRWLRDRRAASPADRRAAAVVLCAGATYLVGTAWYALVVDYQPQGRYVIPALLAIAGLVGAAGGRRAFLVSSITLVGLLGVALATTVSTFGLP